MKARVVFGQAAHVIFVPQTAACCTPLGESQNAAPALFVDLDQTIDIATNAPKPFCKMLVEVQLQWGPYQRSEGRVENF